MVVYTVHEDNKRSLPIEQRAENLVFIKEGFTWLGFIFGPFWLLFNKLWFEVLGAFALGALSFFIMSEIGLASEIAGNMASLLLSLLVGFEGNNLRRWRLERKGYVLLASVAGRDFAECERRFLDHWLSHAFTASANTAPGRIMGASGGKTAAAPAKDWQGSSAIGTLPGVMT